MNRRNFLKAVVAVPLAAAAPLGVSVPAGGLSGIHGTVIDFIVWDDGPYRWVAIQNQVVKDVATVMSDARANREGVADLEVQWIDEDS